MIQKKNLPRNLMKWQEIEVNQSIDEKEIFLNLLGKVNVLNDTSSDGLADIEVR